MFNFLDWIIIILLLLYLIDGWRRGFLMIALELLGFIISLFFALRYYDAAGGILGQWLPLPWQIQRAAGFLAVWFIVQTIYSLILRIIYRLVPKFLQKLLPNRIAGALLAVAKVLILMALLLTVAVNLPLPQSVKTEVEQSSLSQGLLKQSHLWQKQLEKALGRQLNQTIGFLTLPTTPANEAKLDLKFKVSEGKVDEVSEQKMLELVNQERVRYGLKTLKMDPAIREVARAHSKDMFAQGYFSHTNPDGQSPFDRLTKGGVQFRAAGENLAYAPTVIIAHTGLMNSAEHRDNILFPDFGRVGIGVIDAGIYGKMFTQSFAD